MLKERKGISRHCWPAYSLHGGSCTKAEGCPLPGLLDAVMQSHFCLCFLSKESGDIVVFYNSVLFPLVMHPVIIRVPFVLVSQAFPAFLL